MRSSGWECAWCADPEMDEVPENVRLCIDHLAEYMGTSVDMLERGMAIEDAELD